MRTLTQEREAKKVAKKLEHAADYLRKQIYSNEQEFAAAQFAWNQIDSLRFEVIKGSR